MAVNIKYRALNPVVHGETAVKGSPLSNEEIDGNFKSVKDAIEGLSATAVGNTPAGGIAATTVQAAINELDSEKISFTRLDDSDGASLVGYTPAGTGAAATTVQDRLRAYEASGGAALIGYQPAGSGAATTAQARLRTIDTKIGYAASKQASLGLRRTWNSWYSLSSITGARTVNVLGDSISFGAGAGTTRGDVAKNGWVRIFQKFLNLDLGGTNYGFVSAYGENGTGYEIHAVTQTPAVAGQYWGALADAAGGHLPNGWAIKSTNIGDKLRFSPPTNYGKFQIWYDGTQTGTFEVSINGGAAIATVTTTGSGSGLEKTAVLTLSGFSNGSCWIDVTVTAGTAAISGISYLTNSGGFALNNFSRDGRKAQYVSEGVISAMCNGAGAVVWALGANDVGATGADQTAVIQRLTWLTQYANQYGTSVIIVDTLWTYPETNWLRAAMKSAAEAIPGAVYVPTPSLFSPDGSALTAAQLNSRNITYDGTHLTAQGNRMLAETVAQYVNTSVVSKGHIDKLNSLWETMVLTLGVTNASTAVGSMSCYRIAGNRLDICININSPTAGTKIFTVPLGFKTLVFGGNFLSQPDATGKTALITVSTNGDITIYANSSSSGYPAVIAANFSLALNIDGDLQPYN